LNKFNRKQCHFSQNIYISDGVHVPTAIVPGGNRLTVGENKNQFQTVEGLPLQALVAEH